MPIERLPAQAATKDVAAAIERDGCAIVERLLPAGALEVARKELAPWHEATAFGPDSFSGRRTRRTGGLIARSPACREIIMHPLVLATVREVLANATAVQLHLTQLIAIGPDEPGQPIHRDQWAFDFFPFPPGYEVQCNTIWALNDFTAENGATRVIPGSHRFEDRKSFTHDDCEAAEMPAGSVLFYTGSLYHGGGTNRSRETRFGLNLTYVRGWLRQEENQYLAVPPEIARTLPDDLLKIMGYARGAYALGYVDDLRDPLDALRGKTRTTGLGEGEGEAALEAAARRLQRDLERR
jgi:ectoine hydroxylase-related dioxygenase (phytanoyl-CoA dioxygenase family)